MKTAEEIVKALADWSNKYPRGRVYSMNKMSMDEELIEIENMAKEYANQSREEGSGKLPLNITIWKKANSLKYPDFAKWFNKRLEK